MGVVSCQKTEITDTENIFFIFARNTPKYKHKIMKIAICSACVVAIAAAESWMAAPYTLVKRAAEPQRVGTRNNNPNTRFFTGNQPLDAGLAGAAAGLQVNILPISFSIPAETETETTTGVKQTTESSVETLATSFLVLLLVLLGPPLLTIFLEILVEDKILFLLLILVFNLLKI